MGKFIKIVECTIGEHYDSLDSTIEQIVNSTDGFQEISNHEYEALKKYICKHNREVSVYNKDPILVLICEKDLLELKKKSIDLYLKEANKLKKEEDKIKEKQRIKNERAKKRRKEKAEKEAKNKEANELKEFERLNKKFGDGK